MKFKVKEGHAVQFQEALCSVSSIAHGALGFSGVAKLAVRLGFDRELFQLTGNKRIRTKKMKRIFRQAMLQHLADHLEAT